MENNNKQVWTPTTGRALLNLTKIYTPIVDPETHAYENRPVTIKQICDSNRFQTTTVKLPTTGERIPLKDYCNRLYNYLNARHTPEEKAIYWQNLKDVIDSVNNQARQIAGDLHAEYKEELHFTYGNKAKLKSFIKYAQQNGVTIDNLGLIQNIGLNDILSDLQLQFDELKAFLLQNPAYGETGIHVALTEQRDYWLHNLNKYGIVPQQYTLSTKERYTLRLSGYADTADSESIFTVEHKQFHKADSDDELKTIYGRYTVDLQTTLQEDVNILTAVTYASYGMADPDVKDTTEYDPAPTSAEEYQTWYSRNMQDTVDMESPAIWNLIYSD